MIALYLIQGAEPSYTDPLYSWPDYSIPGEYFIAGGTSGEDYYPNIRVLREDQEIIEIMTIIMRSGILN